ncbi:homeobox KN domain-containing protein [Gilbertella persicaria]|uniref:homeobox KN domain-containing protein n=1 Tax=Gilbertella persicaria TaxID=101096 RepID=UPI00221E9A25|nr:homeobox KN domain-containing protein [Gilbertella persicaria]KAI8071163.1 homeobox KN domain-containing protein [Gilbertella persicaria]
MLEYNAQVWENERRMNVSSALLDISLTEPVTRKESLSSSTTESLQQTSPMNDQINDIERQMYTFDIHTNNHPISPKEETPVSKVTEDQITTTFITEPQYYHTYRPYISRRRRRENLPKEVTEYLKQWLIMHKKHPYPTEREKQELADETGLMVNQISNWFINARRRILQPLLEYESHQQQKQRRKQQKQQQHYHHQQEQSANDYHLASSENDNSNPVVQNKKQLSEIAHNV